jgi:malonyl-CoA O-methyltransferase
VKSGALPLPPTVTEPAEESAGQSSLARRKVAILRSFDAAAETYDAHADVQRRIAARLARGLKSLALPPRAMVLEIGCGTGFLSQALRTELPACDLLLTDLSGAMVRRCRERLGEQAGVRYAVMDGERPAVEGGFHLIASSAVFQWFVDLPGALARLAGLLAPGGWLLFATLGDGTFAEWRAAHARLGWTYAGMPLPSRAGLEAMLGQCSGDSRVAFVEEERIVHTYADARTFLHDVKCIGAAVPPEGADRYSPGRLRGLMRALGDGEAPGLPVSYHVLSGALRREGAE